MWYTNSFLSSVLLISSLFLVSCSSVPSKEDGQGIDDRSVENSDSGSKMIKKDEKHRNFDPCLINPNLTVCKGGNEESGKLQSN